MGRRVKVKKEKAPTTKELQARLATAIADRDAMLGDVVILRGKVDRLEGVEEECDGLHRDVRDIAKALAKGRSAALDSEVAIRMFQAEDELRRLRVWITQAALDAVPGGPVAAAMHSVLTGHILHPAKRVTDEE